MEGLAEEERGHYQLFTNLRQRPELKEQIRAEVSTSVTDGNSLYFSIGMEHEEWAGRFGLYKQFGNHMELIVIETMLGYRF